MTRFFKSPLVRLAIGLAASALLLYLAFRTTTFVEVWDVLSQANLWWVLAAFLSVAANNLFKVLRWQVMLGPPGRTVQFPDLLMSNLSGQMLNAVLPVRVGDLSRAYVIGGKGPGRAFVFGTVILEKIVDLFWFALLFLLLLLLIPLPGWVNNSAWFLAVTALVMGLLTFVMAAQRQRLLSIFERMIRRLPEKWRTYLITRLHSGLDSLDVLQQRADLIKIAAWSSVIWTTALLTNQFILLALGIHLDLSASLLILVALIVGISVATVPGRIGVFEWICVLTLGLYGVAQAPALGYGLLLHAVVYAPLVLAGVISFFVLSRGKQSPGS